MYGQPLSAITAEDFRRILIKASNVATQLKAKAFLTAESQASFAFGNLFAPGDRRSRIAMTNFANWAAEYGNQIGARADTLLKQMQVVPADRRELPLSVYLRDTEPTDFMNLMVWNRAAAPAIWEEMLLNPIHSLTSEETTDRVRVIETLFADHNWSRINTVYASGQGETSIALIKDDIGNWNLKSFDTDPTELLNAYKGLTLAAVKVATDAVKAAATGGQSAALSSILGTASKLTQGQIGGGAGNDLNIVNLHNRTDAKIVAKGTARKKDYDAVKKDTMEATEKEKRKVVKRTIEDLKMILENHADMINVLEESVITKPSTTPPAI